ncbi:DUF4175 family protein [Maribellus maritimus]|uniref:DUF4175 family protein n=1 Tax=Maribellus maritimus TaxID=2870838 RepID=UPI001EECA141|nr:DUF4175 family protein [Maribellus maritimus]MCG6190744.1 hypothetical protein [Maribellus maritimus]
MTENFNILVNKLNAFKLRYYSYQILKGLFLVLFILLILYVVFSIIEYNVYLPVEYRKILFYGYTIFGGLLIVQFVGIPLLKLLHILKPIDTKSASVLIQNSFADIKDKLLNVIELASISDKQYSNEIVLASIDQKINELKIFDFNDAVQFKKLRFILLYFGVSIIVTAGIFLANRSIFTESTKRIIHYNTQYVKPAPYTFHLSNTSLQAKKGDAFTIAVNCKGDELPQLVYINIDGNNYLMKNTAAGYFEFEMASVINPVTFYFTDLKYSSEKYNLQLLPKPGITSFNVQITPPSYTLLQNQSFDNIGDIQIPSGTNVEWNFSGIDVDSLYMVFNDSLKVAGSRQNNSFVIESKFYKSTNYSVLIKNRITEAELALTYSIDVIPDLFPEIDVAQVKDSFQVTRFFFKGIIGDDYGFSDLKFHYNIENTDSAFSIPFVRSLSDQEFYYSFDFSTLGEKSGIVSYYFSVTDNDVLNNYKTTTSSSFIFQYPNQEEIAKTEKEQFLKLEDMLKQSIEMAGEIQDDLENLRLKNMEANTSDWEKSQMVNDIISKQNRLEQMYDQIKENNENLNNYLNSFNKQSDEIIEKQKQIEELLEEVFTDELKELMKEFNKLAEEFDSKKLNQLWQQMDLSFEDLQKQMDRNLEMLRKMKIEEKLQKVIDDVNQMAGEERQVGKDILEEKNYERALEEVTEHQQEFNRIENEVKDALDLNNELTEPLNFDDFSEEFEDIKQSFDENKNELNKRNRKKSGESLKNTSEKLQNMAFGMQQMLAQNTMQQNMENIENLKQILSNLIVLSFSQEEVFDGLSGIDANDPRLVELNHEQKRIFDQSKIVRDSLYALAMRTPQINSMVNNELLSMELNLEKSTSQMEEGLFPNAKVNQLFVITSVNNLALMLNEALENLEEQMANAMPGDQQNENPAQGKPGMNMLKNASENLKQQLERMIEQMKNGNKGEMSQQLGESLMQHEMMQQMLRELMNNGKVGSGAKDQLQQIDQLLEQNKKELMNKNINAQTIARQNLITTRLLEAERAELEREYEDKRESETADDFYSNPAKFFEYKEKENYSIEYLYKNSHKLNNFYNNKYKQYLNNIDK